MPSLNWRDWRFTPNLSDLLDLSKPLLPEEKPLSLKLKAVCMGVSFLAHDLADAATASVLSAGKRFRPGASHRQEVK
jgi:hypothetical protein